MTTHQWETKPQRPSTDGVATGERTAARTKVSGKAKVISAERLFLVTIIDDWSNVNQSLHGLLAMSRLLLMSLQQGIKYIYSSPIVTDKIRP